MQNRALERKKSDFFHFLQSGWLPGLMALFSIVFAWIQFAPIARPLRFYWDDWTFLLSQRSAYYGIFQNHWGHIFPFSRILYRIQFLLFDGNHEAYLVCNFVLLIVCTGLLYRLMIRLGAHVWPSSWISMIYFFAVGQWFNVGFANQLSYYSMTLFGLLAAQFCVGVFDRKKMGIVLVLLLLSWLSFSSYIISITFFLAAVRYYCWIQNQENEAPWVKWAPLFFVALGFVLLVVGIRVAAAFPSVHAFANGPTTQLSSLWVRFPQASVWFVIGILYWVLHLVVPYFSMSEGVLDRFTEWAKLLSHDDAGRTWGFASLTLGLMLLPMVLIFYTWVKSQKTKPFLQARPHLVTWVFWVPVVISVAVVAIARTGNINSAMHQRYLTSHLLGGALAWSLWISLALRSAQRWKKGVGDVALVLLGITTIANLSVFQQKAKFISYQNRILTGIDFRADRERCKKDPENTPFPWELSREMTPAQYCLILTGWHPSFALKNPYPSRQ